MGDNSTKMFRQILAIFLNLSKKQDPNPVPEVQTLYHIFSNNPFSPSPTYKLNNLANGLIIMKNFLQKFYPNREHQRNDHQYIYDQQRVFKTVCKIIEPNPADIVMNQENIRRIYSQEPQDLFKSRQGEKELTSKSRYHNRNNRIPERIQNTL